MKLNINGIDKEVSKETCALAVTEYFAKHPEPKPEPEPKYQFQAGDVAETGLGKRIIVRLKGTSELASFGLSGHWQSIGQEEFEENYYKKIGVLKDFIKE